MSHSFSADKVAALAKLQLQPDEQLKLQSDVENILQFVETVARVPLEDVSPFFGSEVSSTPPIRNDEARTGLDRVDALSNAPESDTEHFLVPSVFESHD